MTVGDCCEQSPRARLVPPADPAWRIVVFRGCHTATTPPAWPHPFSAPLMPAARARTHCHAAAAGPKPGYHPARRLRVARWRPPIQLPHYGVLVIASRLPLLPASAVCAAPLAAAPSRACACAAAAAAALLLPALAAAAPARLPAPAALPAAASSLVAAAPAAAEVGVRQRQRGRRLEGHLHLLRSRLQALELLHLRQRTVAQRKVTTAAATPLGPAHARPPGGLRGRGGGVRRGRQACRRASKHV